MKSKFLLLQAAILLFGAPLAADYRSSTSDCCDLGDLSVYTDYVYWKPRVCDTDFAISPSDGSTAIGGIRKIDPDYEHGFRVGFDKTCGCWSFGAQFSYLRANAQSQITDSTNRDIVGTRIIPFYSILTQGTIDTARADWRVHYDVGDVTVGYRAIQCGCFNAKVIGGLKFAFIDHQMNSTYSNTVISEQSTTSTDTIRQSLRMDAYGASLGFEPSYRLMSCIDLFGMFSYDALVGKFERTFLYQTSVTGQNATTRANLTDDCWGMVCVANLRVGLRSAWDGVFCGKGKVIFSAGYEFQHWLNAAGFLGHQNVDSATGPNMITAERCFKGMGFDGLFVRLEANF